MTREERTIRRRRRRGSGSSFGREGLSSSTDGAQNFSGGEPQEDEDINGIVQGRAESAPVSDEPLTEAEGGGSRYDEPADFTPRGRLAHVRKRASNVEREYRLKLLHRLLMRGVALDVIADELQVSPRTIQRDREELFRRLREEAKELDIFELIGKSIGFYEEVKGMSMKAASGAKIPMNLRISAMRTALSANNDMHKFLNTAGVYDVLRFRATETDSQDDIKRLMEVTENLLGLGDDALEDLDTTDLMGGVSTSDDEEELGVLRLL